MSLSFDEVMKVTRTISSPTAFDDDECQTYFDILRVLPPGSIVVEVGLEYGRSSSIALQVAYANRLNYHGIDSYDEHPEIYPEWMEMASTIMPRGGFRVSIVPSNDVVVGNPIDVILIDGDHTYDGVVMDCEHYLPHVNLGGLALFHDYGRDSLPDVKRAVDDYMARHPEEWHRIRTAGTLSVWVRI